MEAVTDVLVGRLREPPGLRRMIGWSLALHVAAVVACVAAPLVWPARVDEPPRTVMTISLSGGSGPQAGGLNPLGGRPIQTTATLPEATRPEPVRPPAERTPEMTVPAARVKPSTRKAEPVEVVKIAPDEARGRTPVRGDQEEFGSAIAETGGQGFGGLSSTGGGGFAGGILEGVTDFCCPEYLGLMQQRIRANWNSRQEVNGTTTMKFRILRDGKIVDLLVEKSSGFVALDLAAQRALVSAAPLPPLPSAFPNSDLTVHLTFEYRR